jgi:uncharacterized protein (DUF1778 family)
MFDTCPFGDGRGRLPDRLAANIPRGFRDAAKKAAEAERVSLSQFVREAVEQRMTQVLKPQEPAHG